MLRLVSTLALSAALLACVTGERMADHPRGMSKDEVIAVLGNPDGFQRSGDYEALRYTNRLISGWSWDRADYNVTLRNGRVVEYGPARSGSEIQRPVP
jgi:hypothetical protein